MRYDRPNDPNAGRLVDSLRHLGYGNYEALADLVDNSIDADAQIISVSVQSKNNQPQISIADNGKGMSEAVLDQAMRLGSITQRDLNSDLGKFGIGPSNGQPIDRQALPRHYPGRRRLPVKRLGPNAGGVNLRSERLSETPRPRNS